MQDGEITRKRTMKREGQEYLFDGMGPKSNAKGKSDDKSKTSYIKRTD